MSSQFQKSKDLSSRAVDGNKGLRTPDCILSDSGQRQAWWQVDLGAEQSLSYIRINYQKKLTDMEARVRLVGGRSEGSGRIEFVHQNIWGTVCDDMFHAKDGAVACVMAGYLPDNVKVREEAYFGAGRGPIWLDDLDCTGEEIDLTTCKNAFREPPNCRHNEDVGVECSVGSTMAGFQIFVSNSKDWWRGHKCFHYTDITAPPSVMNVTCPNHGRYVTFYNERNTSEVYPLTYSKFAYVQLCELEVFGCPSGQYAPDCKRKCPINCDLDRCDIKNGNCFACKDGYIGQRCETECTKGQFGKNCSLTCGNCLYEEPCNFIDGACAKGCSQGWKGFYCNETCNAGFYGLKCTESCSIHCTNPMSCDHVTGNCAESCKDGWEGEKCDKECKALKYGEKCQYSCGHCVNREICNHVTGECSNGCALGWKGDVCDKGYVVI
ncbi:scavenger receptor cysteine-rich type 1 protein M130-like [Saccostrea echinata]|uniref:scavenger receptor cysteine-rich type 1 protein M130-like n=1 Tax=Saccostrea echinata TaxID=191078 RepID=UPI002A824049|nr:scavenger receptor cysteine-rich type 1 protein M130-like [Saccostrea echinata]